MNVSTEANPQDILSQHYNQANEYFQKGEFQKALEALAVARQYAADEHQLAHIESTIATVKQNMGQAAVSVPETESSTEDNMEVSPEKNRPNSMLVLTILVGLVCITPIAMKFIEIFSQPRPDSAVNAVAETASESTTETTSQDSAVTEAAPGTAVNAEGTSNDPTPAATAAVIVNSEQPDAVQNTQVGSSVSMSINASNVNMRAQASVSSSRVATLSQGTQVEAIGQTVSADGFEWQQIKTSSGATGWIASRFLQGNAASSAAATPAAVDAAAVNTSATDTSAATADSPSGTQMRIAGTGISVRTTPGTSGQRLVALSNTQVTVLEPKAMEADGYTWSKIRTQNGTEGWVAHQFLSP